MKKNIIFISAVAVLILLSLVISTQRKISEDKVTENKETTSQKQTTVTNKRFLEMGEKATHYNYSNDEISYEICVNGAELSYELYPEYQEYTYMTNKMDKSITNYEKDGRAFRDEIRYLYVDFTLTNKDDKGGSLRLDERFRHANVNDTEVSVWHDYGYFFRITDGQIKYMPDDGWGGTYIKLEAGEKVNLRVIYMVLPCWLYNEHFTTDYDNASYVDLNLGVYETGYLTFYVGDAPYDYDKRDKKRAKIRNKVTSLDNVEEQEEGCKVHDSFLFDIGDVVGTPYYQAPGESIPNMQMEIYEAVLYDDISELPERFGENGYLSDMTDVYVEKSGGSTEDYRYLYVKVKMKQLCNLFEVVWSTEQCMWIYNRDEDGYMWQFGYPDDYYILSATNEKQNLGNYSEPYTNEGDELVVEAAYVIPPDMVYDLYLFTACDDIIDSSETHYADGTKDKIYGFIDLNMNLKEEGGVK